MPHNIQLDIIDSNLHFIERSVSLFEQTKIANVKDLKDINAIEDFMEENVKCVEKKEDFVDYLHKKIPCQLKLDVKKQQYYKDIRNTITDMCLGEKSISALVSASANEFIFDEILPDGKLLIPNRCRDDDDDENKNDARLKDIVSEQMELSWSKFCKMYNTNLSSTEKKAIFKDLSWSKKRKRKLVRNVHGKFVKQNDTTFEMESSSKGDCYAKETEMISAAVDISEIENTLPELSDILNSSTNVSVFDNLIKVESGYGMDDHHESKKSCKALGSIINESLFISDKKSNSDNIHRLFRPFKDYWMYHCNFSRVKPKNFELLEKMLPKSFRWLLKEGANVVEMSAEDLYEEVCLVEAYCASALERSKIYSSNATSESENCNNRAYINAILKKW